jgi:predicted short-subunit dehydrogenase-like oxidoreductase (DUF2520 family)
MTSVRIIGRGRAGRSFGEALASVGVEVRGILGRTDEVGSAAQGVDLVLLAVPDRAVSEVASAVRPVRATVMAHCSGAFGLEVLGAHERVASLHPLLTLPDPVVGAHRLCSGGYFAVAGDPLAIELVGALGGRPLALPAQARARYHAAACLASNHLVALLGQVERIAASVGLPLEAFLPLAQGALDDVRALGPRAALTGPASRNDLITIERHRQALDPEERAGYDAGVALARRLAASAAPAQTPSPSAAAESDRIVDAELAGLAGTGSWR